MGRSRESQAVSEEKGAINIYTCPSCGWRAITRNRDDGTTPFMIACEGKDCEADPRVGGCTSAFYRVDQTLEPTHEWYRPLSAGERKAMKDPALRDHVRMGGLLLRKIAVH